jgi:general secretion pathway protein M
MSSATPPAPPAPAWTATLAAWRERWQALGSRDRGLAGVAAALFGAFLLWSVAVQPAWRTLRDAPAQREALESQWQSMQLLAAEARQLRDAPKIGSEQAAAALRSASDRLGTRAKLSLQGDRAVLTLNGVSTAQLREWLAEARAGARARPVEAQLSRGPQGFTGSVVLQVGGGS